MGTETVPVAAPVSWGCPSAVQCPGSPETCLSHLCSTVLMQDVEANAKRCIWGQ